jgi:hypothetical protein
MVLNKDIDVVPPIKTTQLLLKNFSISFPASPLIKNSYAAL